MKDLYPKLLVIVLLVPIICEGQNISVNTTGSANSTSSMFEVIQPAGAASGSVGIFARHLGTAANAYAIWAEATGATNKYAIVVPAGGGSVGIGTTTPGWPLDIVNNQNFYTLIGIRNSDPGTSAASGLIMYNDVAGNYAGFGVSSSGFNTAPFGILGTNRAFWSTNAAMSGIIINTEGADPIMFATAFAERMRITGTGEVGIGTSTPSSGFGYLLEVYSGNAFVKNGATNYYTGLVGTGATSTGLIFRKDGTRHAAFKWDGTKLYLGDGSADCCVSDNWNSPQTTWDISTGYMGIGTTAPVRLLDIDGNASPAYLILHNTVGGGGKTSTDGFELSYGLSNEAWLWNYENADMYFGTNNATRMSILANGLIGVNMIPAMQLDVTSATTTAGNATIRGASTGNAAVYGVFGSVTSTTGTAAGIHGSASGGTGVVHGVYGISSSTTAGAAGVYGSSAGGGGNHGVYGINTVANGNGVTGECNVGAGAYGVWGKSSTGYGGYFEATAGVAGNFALGIDDGHIKIIQTTAPTSAVTANAGTTASTSLTTANDIIGTLTLTTGTGAWASGTQVTVTFNKVYSTAPIVVLTPTNQATASAMNSRQWYVSSAVGSFSINFGIAAVASVIYQWNYHILEP